MEMFAIPSTGRDGVSDRDHSAQIWESHRERIKQLYWEEDKSLDEVIAVMHNVYGFTATPRQYKTRLSLWHLDKNIKDSEIRFIAQTQVKRAHEDKETNFRVRGRDVDPEKISRAVKRKKISDEELLVMAAAPTPSDISYNTPSAVDPVSPFAQKPAVQEHSQILYSSPNQVLVQSSEWQNPASFLLSPGYQPATPLPVGWYGPSTSFTSGSLQTPPGILQSPGSLWNTGFVDGMLDSSDASAYVDHSDIYEIKYARLIELVKETEEIESIDYMKAMSEVNSLAYDLITYDQSRSEIIVEQSSVHVPKCYVCRALEEIGRKTMASKVESERVLLEAIAISEGRFGEEHSAPFHFQIKLAALYKYWSCRSDSTSFFQRIASLALRKAPTRNWADLLSELLIPSNTNGPILCAWLQGPAWESSFATSSQQLSTLSIEGETVRDSPPTLWEMIKFTINLVGYIDDDVDGGFSNLESILDSILRQGPELVDGSLSFWMAIFLSATYRMWRPIFNSRYLISDTANRDSLPGSIALKASFERLCENPYRLEQTKTIAMNGEGDSSLESSDEPSSSENPLRFEDISKLEGPLENLDQLRLVLTELSLSELGKSGFSEAFASHPAIINVHHMLDILCSAAQHGNSNLIKYLEIHFRNTQFESFSFTDVLNLGGMSERWSDEAPLCCAVRTGHRPTIEALLDAGADPDGPDECDERPAYIATEVGYYEIACLLINQGAVLWSRSNRERVLTYIIENSDQETLENLLENCPDDEFLFNLLFSVYLIGYIENYELLGTVSEMIKEHIRPTENEMPKLRSILETWDKEELLEFAADLDKSGRGLELLLNAFTGVHIEQQAREILKTALFGLETELGKMLSPSESSGADRPALHTLVSRNAPNALGVFLELGPNLEASDEHGNTALHFAAARNRLDCARQLLKHGININRENMSGETALQIAVSAGHTEISEEIRMLSPASTEDEGNGSVV